MSGSSTPSSAKLFLGGLSWDTTEEKLRDHFSKYGSIVEAVVMRDRQTGRPRGFGFVTFTAPEAADAVVQDIHVIDGRQIDAKKSVPQEQKPKARKVFVGGLSPETTEDQFRDYFSQYGEVVEAQIMQDHMSGRSRGFGFVTFAEDASAENVFATGTMHDLGGKKVEVKPATPKGSGSLARPAGGAPSGRPGPGAGASGAGGRAMPPFGGPGGPGSAAMFGSPPGPYGGYGMYGYPPAGMMPTAAAFGMQYGSSMGGQMHGGMAAHSPYMMMAGMPQMGSYPPPGAAFGFPPGGALTGPAFPPTHGGGGGRSGGGGGAQGTPFAMAQQQAGQQHMQGQPQQSQQYPRPVRMMSRTGSRGAGKVDSASSLEHHGGGDAAHAGAAAHSMGAVQAQLGKLALAE
ncbi:heterogeneous nuclear ribonucleo 1 [Micractinium conductrix]|uniref:Heterogeneous nuclear ribonucleo 1 n=1 Tax=Micractinium conductrix TaxID=554055 RepID=A0A2P6VRQ8_9CHLO|nr:heterogeneous nuclear ribonucleo 1 [Micractinium conductrix]|eukprot:PSC76786.1 heterogeneous nuclear ribonucleo 1 [Micractinium conductrix]